MACSPAGTWLPRSALPTPPGRSSRRGSPARMPCRPPQRSRPYWRRQHVLEDQRRMLLETRAHTPSAVAAAAAGRRRRPWLGPSGRLMILAAAHPARGALGVGERPMAMANRFELLDRIMVALARPGVDGVLGTADVIEDLLLLGALDGKLAIGSMNRGGLPGGKMLLRIDPDNPDTVATIASCAEAAGELAARQIRAMIEPFMVKRVDGRAVNDLGADAVIRSIAI